MQIPAQLTRVIFQYRKFPDFLRPSLVSLPIHYLFPTQNTRKKAKRWAYCAPSSGPHVFADFSRPSGANYNSFDLHPIFRLIYIWSRTSPDLNCRKRMGEGREQGNQFLLMSGMVWNLFSSYPQSR